MITYIGFSTQTHKPIAKFVCHKFKHCAPVIIDKNNVKIYQFTKYRNVNIIEIKLRDIKILKRYGWIFIKYKNNKKTPKYKQIHAITCVHFTKQFFNIHKISIQTPDALLKHLKKDQFLSS